VRRRTRFYAVMWRERGSPTGYLPHACSALCRVRAAEELQKRDAVLVMNVPTALASATAAAKSVVAVIERHRQKRVAAKLVFAMWIGGGGSASAAHDRAPKARELIVGVADDPTFGPVIVFGQGGTAVEVISDKALALPPLDLALARRLIARTRVARILKAYRNVAAADERAIELLLVKLAQLVADFPEIRETDLNPVFADETGVIAVDARVSVAPVDKPR
jgi:acetyltransferase